MHYGYGIRELSHDQPNSNDDSRGGSDGGCGGEHPLDAQAPLIEPTLYFLDIDKQYNV